MAAATFVALTVAVTTDLPGEREPRLEVRALEPAARVVDAGTGYLPVVALTAVAVAVLLARTRARDAARTTVAVGVALVGTALLKQLVDRPRPEALDGLSPGYPSGHAAATAVLVAVVVLCTARRRPALLAGSALVAVAGLAQLVLARHHPSDLLGGWLWAVAVACTAWAVSPRR